MPGRLFVLGAVLLALFGGAGCERLRACLAIARGDRQEPASSVAAGIAAYDCPPGIVRCVEGRVELSVGGAIDGPTLERKGCPFEVIDACNGRCADDDDHLEEELPELCVGDALYRARHPRAISVQDAGDEADASNADER